MQTFVRATAEAVAISLFVGAVLFLAAGVPA